MMSQKILSTALALVFGLSVMPAAPAMAQSDDYARLYQEFLRRIEEGSGSTPAPQPTATPPAPEPTPEPMMAPEPTPAPTPTRYQPMTRSQVRTSDYSLVGKVTRDEQGAYFIHLADKPGYYYRVYGQDNAKEIMRAVKYAKVQLIGKKAYFNGKHVGISARDVVVLEEYPEKAQTQTRTQARTMPQEEMHEEMSWMGRIEINDQGHPYLKVPVGNAEAAYRLVNRDQWKMAFEHAYKGTVRVRGWKNAKGVIRYSSISR